MHYVLGDIHNDNNRFEAMLQKIELKEEDHLIVLGDLFDRCGSDPDPVGVYFNILKLGHKVSVIMGNHELMLSKFIDDYYNTPERKRHKIQPYGYNSFDLMKERLTEVDMKNLSSFIKRFQAQIQITLDGVTYLFAHAMTSLPEDKRSLTYYTNGILDDAFYKNGIPGYVSICGHTDTSFFAHYGGTYSDKNNPSIWKNDLNNVFMVDCGCGFSGGRLACMCLETSEEYYV